MQHPGKRTLFVNASVQVVCSLSADTCLLVALGVVTEKQINVLPRCFFVCFRDFSKSVKASVSQSWAKYWGYFKSWMKCTPIGVRES